MKSDLMSIMNNNLLTGDSLKIFYSIDIIELAIASIKSIKKLTSAITRTHKRNQYGGLTICVNAPPIVTIPT